METYLSIIKTHSGRDKILRTAAYAFVIISSYLKEKTAQKLSLISKLINISRSVLRFFEDIPAYQTLKKWGKEEKDELTRLFSVAGNLFIQFHFPLDHLAFAVDQKILRSKTNFRNLSSVFLMFSLLFGFFKSVRKYFLALREEESLKHQVELAALEGSRPQTPSENIDQSNHHKKYFPYLTILTPTLPSIPSFLKKNMELCLVTKETEFLNIIKNIFDLLVILSSLNILPIKSPLKIAKLGFISSVFSLFLLIKTHST